MSANTRDFCRTYSSTGVSRNEWEIDEAKLATFAMLVNSGATRRAAEYAGEVISEEEDDQ